MSWLDLSNGDGSMSSLMFAGVTALSRLATSKKHAMIRQECQQVANHIQEQVKRNNEAIRAGIPVQQDTDANKYFLVLKLACDTGVSKLMCLALDIIQKLISFGYLDGSNVVDPRLYPNPNPHMQPSAGGAPLIQMQQKITAMIAEGVAAATSDNATATSSSASEPTGLPTLPSDLTLASLTSMAPAAVLSAAGSDGKLIAVLLDTLYHCACYRDQQVQLLVLKCVLTCITSASCSVHGWSLLQAVSTCYQIYLANPSHTNNAGEEINRVTAKATLTQIFNLVFQRMEHFSQQLKQMQTVQQQQQQVVVTSENGTGHAANGPPSQTITPDPSASPMPTPSPDPSVTPAPVNGEAAAAANSGASLKPPLHPSSGVVAPAAANNTTPGPTPSPLQAGRRGFCVWCNRPANHYCLQTKDAVCGLDCKLQNLRLKDPDSKLTQQLMRKVILQLELCQNDAYYLLRALCKLAIKVLPPTAGAEKTDANTIAVDSKILSLQLLLSILSNAGPTFRTTKHFISCVKGDLVNVILRNSAASSIETIFALSSSLFVSLICHFKPYLYTVIGPVLDSIYLPYISSPNSTFEHKYISLTVLYKISLDPQSLLEIFINYDCETGSLGNTFQKYSSIIEKVCRSRFVSENWLSVQEESKLRLLALECLVETIKSLLTWTKKAQVNLIQRKEALALADAALQQALSKDAYESDEESELNTTGPSSTNLSSSSSASSSTRSIKHHPRHSVMLPAPTPTSNAANSGTGTDDSTSSFSMQQFHALKLQKQKLDTGILKFNMRGGKKGLTYLANHGLLQLDNPASVADFFIQNVAALDKVHVGDFMGEDDEFNKKVLYNYVEKLHFAGLTFDDAIRKFLNGFWLPGEAQKIDRMMEKFAEQYHRHNPGNFSSADTAYVLAYSVIMLNTDAHSPNVKYRMTKEDFFKNCRGIDDGKDINPAFLSDIYDRITTNEIKMKDGDPYRRGLKDKSSGNKEVMKRDRINMFVQESQELVKKTQDYLENFQKKHELEMQAQASGGSGAPSSSSNPLDPSKRRLSVEVEETKVFQQATDTDIEAVRPMFEILWYPSLATFSVLLEENEAKSDDYNVNASASQSHPQNSHVFRIIELCLDGYRHAIRLSSALGIETSRLAFVTSLRKFTLLGSTREMKQANIEAIKMLLMISHTEGNHLQDSWMDVLQCISELERLHLFATSRPIADVFQSSPMRTRESDSINSLHVNKIDASSIDRVFTSSAHLDANAIVDFVKALRAVSEQELSNISAPRVFSLQKIVEITYYNMGRIRVVWSKIWTILSSYFTKAGCHPNLNVSMYAIDSLRQLAMKFLEKDELASFQFQKQFFKPFELIMLNNTSNETRELIVQCMHRMVASRVTNIKSGWKGVFVVIHTAASQTYQPLVVAAFELLVNIMEHHFNLLTTTTDTMDDCVNALVAFGCNNFTAISLKAIHYINQCCDHLGAQQVARRERLAARIAHAEAAGGSDGGSHPATPVRSRGASTTATPNDLSVSVPASPIVQGMANNNDELDLGLLSPSNASNASASTMQMDLKIWFLALTGLSRMVLDPRPEVRSRALLALFKILASHGSHFSASTWRAVFCGVLFPIFDDVRHSSDPLKKRSSGGPMVGGTAGSEASTPVAREELPSVTARGWGTAHHISPWRNPNNWSWPAGASSPRVMSRPTANHPSAATTATHSREPSTPPVVNGIASVTSAPAAHVPAAAPATPTPVTRAIPTLPPKPPTNPRLPSMPPPIPSVTTQRPQQPPRGVAAVAPTPENSWLQTTCFSALSTLVELFDHFYPSVSFMLPDLLALIHSCISQESEDLARIGIRCLVMLVTKVGTKLSIAAWWTTLESLAEIIQKTMPLELMSGKLRAILGLPEIDQHGEEISYDLGSQSRANSRPGSRRNSSAVQGNAAAGATPSSNAATVAANSVELSPIEASPTSIAPTNVTVDAPAQQPATTPPKHAPPAPLSIPSPSVAAATSPSPSQTQPPPSPAGTGARVPGGPSLSPLPPPTAGATPALPFASHIIVGKFRVQLQLLEALFQIADAFFPAKGVEQAREKGAFKHSGKKAAHEPAELDFLSSNGSSSGGEVSIVSTDEQVVGRLTCEQLFFALDLLSSSLSFARAFNLNLLLRRKLYSFGFQTEQTVLGRLPQLFLQETRATRLYVHLLFRLIREGGTEESVEHEKQSMDGARWLALQETEGAEEALATGATPLQPSYEAYVRLAESRCISLALRFLSDYVSKSVSGQMVSLEFSEELLCSFIENLHRISSVSPIRFQNYLSIFYFPLVQLISFGRENIRQHLGALFQHALPSMLPFTPITPYPLIKLQPVAVPLPVVNVASENTTQPTKPTE